MPERRQIFKVPPTIKLVAATQVASLIHLAAGFRGSSTKERATYLVSLGDRGKHIPELNGVDWHQASLLQREG